MAKNLAKGTQLQIGDGASPENFTAIVQLTKIQTPLLKRNKVDVTDHDSTDAYEYLGEALYDGGEITFSGHWDPTLATHTAAATGGIMYAFLNNVQGNFKIVLTDTAGTNVTFPAHISEAPMADVDFKSALDFTFKIQVDGAVTWA